MRADVFFEIERALQKFPRWPTDPIHASGIVLEEAGELMKAVMEATYEPHKSGPDEVRAEVIQLAAMAHRFLMSLELYEYTPSAQHAQRLGCAACDRGDFQLGHADSCQARPTRKLRVDE